MQQVERNITYIRFLLTLTAYIAKYVYNTYETDVQISTDIIISIYTTYKYILHTGGCIFIYLFNNN